MRSAEHTQHILNNQSWNNCPECRADCERRFTEPARKFEYKHVHDYLAWAKPRLDVIRAGNRSFEANMWHERFMEALHRRISLSISRQCRKYSDGYIDRLRMMSHIHDVGYLQRFAQRGASCLD